MTIPRYQKGAPLKAADLNLLSDAVARCRVLPGVGIKLTETVNGTVVSLKPTRISGKSEQEPRPWDIINITGIGEPNNDGIYDSYTAQVNWGTLNGILPTNMVTSGELTVFNFSKNTVYWKCRCQTDGKRITTATIVAEATNASAQMLVPNAIPAQAEFVFAITKNGNPYRTIGDGNPRYDVQRNFIVNHTSSPPPGVPGYDRYFEIRFQ